MNAQRNLKWLGSSVQRAPSRRRTWRLGRAARLSSPQASTPGTQRDDGIVVIAVLVALVISVTLFGLCARAAVREHRQLANQHLRLQTTRLAEAGLQRAIAQRTANPQYTEETWSIPAVDLAGPHAAQVQISVTPNTDGTALALKAVAKYPIGEVRHAQVTKEIQIRNPNRENST